MNLPCALLLAASVIGANTQSTTKIPHFLECTPDAVVISADGTKVEWAELQRPGNAVEIMLDGIQKNSGKEYVVVLVHPQSVKFYRYVRNLIGKRTIDVGYEALDADVHLMDGSVVDQKGRKLSEFRVAARAIPTTRNPVFFECRGNEVTFIDKDSLDVQVAKKLSKINPEVRKGNLSNFLKAIQKEEIGNLFYRVDPKYLLVGVMALERRKEVPGETAEQIDQPTSIFRMVIKTLDAKQRYAAFLIRDDSFAIFRKVRYLAEAQGIDSAWELLGDDEPIKFGQGGTSIAPQ